jgi:hypothetical protein
MTIAVLAGHRLARRRGRGIPHEPRAEFEVANEGAHNVTTTLSPVIASRLEKAAVDNGFDQELPPPPSPAARRSLEPTSEKAQRC